MSKTLTKNARWIILWVRFTDKHSDLCVLHEQAFNIGRYHYSTPTRLAIADALDFSRYRILESHVYEVDVAVYPYAKQWQEVSELADEYFARQHPKPQQGEK